MREKRTLHSQISLRDLVSKTGRTKTEREDRRLSKVIGVSPKSVSIKNYKSRWGSCSSNGELTYNWRIILAPHRIVDYVVVHELCHLLEHNHSPKYWKHVEHYVPNWREHRDWLRKHTTELWQ